MQLSISVEDVGLLMTHLERNDIPSTTPGLLYDVVENILDYPDDIAAVVASFDPDEPAPSQPIRLSFLQFMDLFTVDEQMALAGAAMTDVPTKLWYDRAVGAQFIDLSDERLATGLQAMVDAELLTSARRNRVLKGLTPA